MFKKKQPNIAKLERKLYLARENPELIFDLSDCELPHVPPGIYSLCRVFLKEELLLQCNQLHSLEGGGSLGDLHLLKILNLNHNSLTQLPKEIGLLTSLQQLHISNNLLCRLPTSIFSLTNLRLLDLSNNKLKMLPPDLGQLTHIRECYLKNNKISMLPNTLHRWRCVKVLEVDGEKMISPPSEVFREGLEEVMRWFFQDAGVEYEPLEDDGGEIGKQIVENFSEKHLKMQQFIEIEKLNELASRQELEQAMASKTQKDKLLTVLIEQRDQLDGELMKLTKEKEIERFKLVEQLQEAEQMADSAIENLLSLNDYPLRRFLFAEPQLEVSLSAVSEVTAAKKEEILLNMRDILAQETAKFRELDQNRIDNSRSILEQESEFDEKILDILRDKNVHKSELIDDLLRIEDLQKAAVITLLERSDCASWSLLEQIKLVEQQLASLTKIEIEKRRLKMDDHLNDFCERRCDLSCLLIELLDRQKERRSQLILEIHTMEKNRKESTEEFWLQQYQRLLDKLPDGLAHAQENMDPRLSHSLLVNGVVHCLPFLAKIMQSGRTVTDEELIAVGVTNGSERHKILEAIHYCSQKQDDDDGACASAPPMTDEETVASAPIPENIRTIGSTECVVCLDTECQIIFVPCGHLCCCNMCSLSLDACPLCRVRIHTKITIVI